MRELIRAPLWLIGLLLVAAIGVGIYAYFTTPLPLGLSSVVRTPGGGALAGPTPVAVGTSVGARTAAGQPLVLGATTVSVQSVLRNQDLTTNNRGGPPGNFTLVDLTIQNFGTSPLTPKTSDFALQDEQGRTYAVDAEATRAVNAAAKRRGIFDTSVPPTGSVLTLLAFETATDSTSISLHVMLGYGDLELPR